MDKTEIKYMKTSDLIPYEKNPRNNDAAVEKVAKSIEEFGFRVPIIVDKDNVIIAGHTRLKASQLLRLDEVPVIVASNLDKKKVKAFRLADNKVSEEAEWNIDLLEEELRDLEGVFTGFSEDEFDAMINNVPKENPYTDKNIAPQYEIKGEQPEVDALVDDGKVKRLEEDILYSNLEESEKEFLLMAAKRHYVFNYANIAEYYANASEEMQQLMEQSALVIIDYDDAILNGYATLNKEITEMIEGEDE